MLNRRNLLAAAVAAVLMPAAASAQAGWPNKPVRIIVPYGAGGAGDTLARLVGEELSKTLGQQFVVENVTGAGGTIGVGQVAKASPDGYTLGVNNISTSVIAPYINPNVPYDADKDFSYIALLGGSPTVLTVNAKLGIKTHQELLDYARASSTVPGYGTSGAGTLSHLLALKYFADENVPFEHIAYGGAGEALLDVVGGHIPAASATLATSLPHIQSGAILPLAVSTAERDPAIPDVPTFNELGHPDLASSTWFGFIGPAGLPDEIVTKLNTEINRILDLPHVKARLEPEGLTADRLTAEEFTKYRADQAAIWGPIAEQAELQ